MEKKIKWGVIGSGGIARRRTIPEGIMAADNAELTAVFDVNAEANAEVAKEFSATACTGKAELFGRDDVEAVYIATPANLHNDQVLAAAAAGKHILCEKPLGMSVAEAEAMIAACEQAGVKLGVGFMMRFHAYHAEALRMVKDGALGKCVLGRAQLSCWYPPMAGAWRQDPAGGGGGSLMDMGGHCIDLLEMFFGPARKVCCMTGNLVHDYKSEDSATVILQFDNGAHGVVDTFFCIPDASSKNRLELYGSGGSILAEGTIGQGPGGTMTAYLEESGKKYNAQQAREGESGPITIAPEEVNTYQAEIEEMGKAIIENRLPANSAADALQSTKVIAACYESARTGKAVAI
jgi:predicted dehydrogenase